MRGLPGRHALPGDHALVIGAGMAGLLAARVLSDAFSRVTVLERDEANSASAIAEQR